MERLDVWISTNSLVFRDFGGYETRNPATMRMIREAWETYIRNPQPLAKVRHITLTTGDQYKADMDFSYGVPSKDLVAKSVPSFVFEDWPEIGIPSYQAVFDAMVEAGSRPPTNPRVFWIGALTNPFRKTACEIARQYPDVMDFRLMQWNRSNPKTLSTNTPTYVSLVDHCAYRVLIDLGAGGFSGRLPLLFASGRPVILLDRPVESWFYWEMTPWEHYIPCTEETLVERVLWTVEHPEEAEEIGRRGQAYAREHLTHAMAVRRWADCLAEKLTP